MYKNDVWRLEKALFLENSPVGIKFIKNENKYNNVDLPTIKGKINFCYMVRRAIRGKHFKVNADNFRCINAVYAMGLVEPNEHVTSGEILSICGLYENEVIAKQVIDSMKYLDQKIYGLEIGPLSEMADVDAVIIIANALQVMRIFQGYTYGHGPAENLLSMGNQAMCSDLVAKPLSNNDINVSFFCKGARLFGQCSDGELGVGMPGTMFPKVVDGVIKTLTPVENNKVKQKILDGLDEPKALDTEIVMDTDYVKTIAAYVKNLNKS